MPIRSPNVTAATVRAYFDREADKGNPLLPDPMTVSGLGTYRKYKQAVELMVHPAVANVLDLGCNCGSVEFLFHQLHPAKARTTAVHGIDVSSKAIEQATALQLPNCVFRVYDGCRLPYESDTFDLVLMVEVIEHVIDKESLLREVWRVLTPAGRLFLTTPNPECWALTAERALWWALRTAFRKPHLAKDAFISQRALATLLGRSGFPGADRICRFAWPHLFIYFLGWSILPPLPPKALYWYQVYCQNLLDGANAPSWLNRQIQWTSVALANKRV